jgi:hypothetical protein
LYLCTNEADQQVLQDLKKYFNGFS